MICSISIKNFIIIDSLEITFQELFTAITGETGTGKSIIIDAIDFCFGKFQSKNIKKNPDTDCVVSITFDHNLNITKTINKDNKTMTFMNNVATTKKNLQEQHKDLIDITSQFDSIFTVNQHQKILDEFLLATNPGIIHDFINLTNFFDELQDANKKISAIETNILTLKRDREYHSEIVAELQKLNISPDEETTLLSSRVELAKLNTCHNAIRTSAEILKSIHIGSKFSSVTRHLEKIDHAKIQILKERLNSVAIECEDIIQELEDISNSMLLNEEELVKIDNRLSILRAAARKYNASSNLLFEFFEEIKQKLTMSDKLENHLKDMKQHKNYIFTQYQKASQKIHDARFKAARELSDKVYQKLGELLMSDASFDIGIRYNEKKISSSGQDDIEFLANFNKKSSLMPFSQIASGGEAARLNFAMKMVVGIAGKAKTIIFDEIDIGIGGAAAYAMGTAMRKFSKDNKIQIISITHSAQVAALSNDHILIQKINKNNSITVCAKSLSIEEKTLEIARMISGESITKEAIAAAKHLIKIEKKPKEAGNTTQTK